MNINILWHYGFVWLILKRYFWWSPPTLCLFCLVRPFSSFSLSQSPPSAKAMESVQKCWKAKSVRSKNPSPHWQDNKHFVHTRKERKRNFLKKEAKRKKTFFLSFFCCAQDEERKKKFWVTTSFSLSCSTNSLMLDLFLLAHTSIISD